MPEPPTDAVLVARHRAGDPRAFDLLHQRHRPRLVRYAERVLGGHAAAAEDVVQEALWRAHQALLEDDRSVALAPWLFTIVRNRCIDVTRRAPLTAADPLERVPDARADAHAGLLRRERLRSVVRDVRALPERQRLALVGHVLCDEPHERLARELGVSVDGSKALLRRARTTLGRLAAEAA